MSQQNINIQTRQGTTQSDLGPQRTEFARMQNERFAGIELAKVPDLKEPHLSRIQVPQEQARLIMESMNHGDFVAARPELLFPGQEQGVLPEANVVIEDIAHSESEIIDITNVAPGKSLNIPLKGQSFADKIERGVNKIAQEEVMPKKTEKAKEHFKDFFGISSERVSTGADLNIRGITTESLRVSTANGTIVIDNGSTPPQILFEKDKTETQPFKMTDLWPNSKSTETVTIGLVKYIDDNGVPRIGLEIKKVKPVEQKVETPEEKYSSLKNQALEALERRDIAEVFKILNNEILSNANTQLSKVDRNKPPKLPLELMIFDNVETFLGRAESPTNRQLQTIGTTETPGRCNIVMKGEEGKNYVGRAHTLVTSQFADEQKYYRLQKTSSSSGTLKLVWTPPNKCNWVKTSEDFNLFATEFAFINFGQDFQNTSYFVINSGSRLIMLRFEDKDIDISNKADTVIKFVRKVIEATANAAYENEANPPIENRDRKQLRVLDQDMKLK